MSFLGEGRAYLGSALTRKGSAEFSYKGDSVQDAMAGVLAQVLQWVEDRRQTVYDGDKLRVNLRMEVTEWTA